MIKNISVLNLFFDIPLHKNGVPIQKLDFYAGSIEKDVISNPKFREHLFGIFPLKNKKCWVHYYNYGELTHIGLYEQGQIKKANLSRLPYKQIKQAMELVFDPDDFNFLIELCEMQIAEMEQDEIFNIWETGDGEFEALTMTHLRTIIATRNIVPENCQYDNIATLTCVQDRLPCSAIIVRNQSWSDALYNSEQFMEIIKQEEELMVDLEEDRFGNIQLSLF